MRGGSYNPSRPSKQLSKTGSIALICGGTASLGRNASSIIVLQKPSLPGGSPFKLSPSASGLPLLSQLAWQR